MPHLGPESLAPGMAPGGVVVHVYTSTGDLVLIRALRPGDDVEAAGEVDGASVAPQYVGPGPLHVATFDGDTGERMAPDTW